MSVVESTIKLLYQIWGDKQTYMILWTYVLGNEEPADSIMVVARA